jgi:hypothetical protein
MSGNRRRHSDYEAGSNNTATTSHFTYNSQPNVYNQQENVYQSSVAYNAVYQLDNQQQQHDSGYMSCSGDNSRLHTSNTSWETPLNERYGCVNVQQIQVFTVDFRQYHYIHPSSSTTIHYHHSAHALNTTPSSIHRQHEPITCSPFQLFHPDGATGTIVYILFLC